MPEHQNLEWKTSWRDEYLKWICGFANASGGVLEIGKDDRGEATGLQDILRLLEEIPNKTQALLGIVVDVNLRTQEGREYLEIVVQPHPNPVSYRGEFHYRSGSTKQVLQGAALSRFLLQRFGRTWDDVPLPDVSLRDLDSRALDGFRRRGADAGRLPAGVEAESDDWIIEHLQLREGQHLKRAAALLFHPAPHRFALGAMVKIGAFRGSEVLYQDVIEGDLFAQVEQTVDLLRTKYTKALISYDGLYRVETFPVPRQALREAVLNAVIHRDYQNPSPTQIRVYEDRIALWNPAELPAGWTANPDGGEQASKPFNPRIAYAFFRAGMIEAWGRGLQRIRDACQTAGVPAPAWEPQPDGGLWLRFGFSQAYREAGERAAGDQEPDHPKTARKQPENSQETARKQPENSQKTARKRPGNSQKTARKRPGNSQKTARKQPENSQETARKQPENSQKTARKTTRDTGRRILTVLRRNPTAGRREIAAALDGLTESAARYHLDLLRAAGRIRRVGPTKGGRWEVLEPSRD